MYDVIINSNNSDWTIATISSLINIYDKNTDFSWHATMLSNVIRFSRNLHQRTDTVRLRQDKSSAKNTQCDNEDSREVMTPIPSSLGDCFVHDETTFEFVSVWRHTNARLLD